MKPDPGRGHAEGQVRRGQPSPRTQAPGLPVTLGTGVAGRLHGHRHDQAAGQTPQAPSPAGALSRAHTPPSFAESLGRWGLQQGTGPALTHTAPPAELAWVSAAHRRKGEGSGLFLGATHPRLSSATGSQRCLQDAGSASSLLSQPGLAQDHGHPRVCAWWPLSP